MSTTLRQFAEGVPRGAGHTTVCAAAAIQANATMVVGSSAVAAMLRRTYSALKVATVADVAARRVRGPMIIDPDAVQALAIAQAGPLPGDFAGEQTGRISA